MPMTSEELAHKLLRMPQAQVMVAGAPGQPPTPLEDRHVLFNAEANAVVIDLGNAPAPVSECPPQSV